MLKSFHTRILLILITLFSYGLRVWGLQFGLPFEYHPDEQQYILPAIGVVSGNFEPLAYYNPTFYPYLLGGVYTLTYLGLRLFNAFPEFWDLNVAWSNAMQPWTAGIIYLARYTTAVVGVLTTLMVYHLGRRAYNRVTGVGAAILFGLTFLPAREAHFAVSDTPVALLVTITLYFCLKIVQRGHWPDYLWAGIAFGLATATKYNAVLLAPTIILAHLLSNRYPNWSKRLRSIWLLVIGGLAGVVSYLLVSPYTVLRWSEFWGDFSENLQSGQQGFQGLALDPSGSGAIFYAKSLVWGMGWSVFLLGVAAVIFALWRHRRADLLLLSFPLLVFFFIQRQEMYFVRWLTPLIPPMCVLAAETLHAAICRLQKQRLLKWPTAATTLTMITLFALPSTIMTAKADHIFNQTDTRTEALHWIQHNLPPGSNVAARILSPPWAPPLTMPGLRIGPYNFAQVPNGGIADVKMEQYKMWGTQYVIATSFFYAQPQLDQQYQAERAARMKTLDEQAELIALFNPYFKNYTGFFYHDQVYGPANDTPFRQQPGPIIKIYRLP
jgi:hypothetical protein